ncbi:facilitated trehalose transporter Tret1-like isoform X2 [Leptopilina boulardi]|nr:facilitated trehalose transporter Tret1-like isoform X2 [Leptopilina boulardi]
MTVGYSSIALPYLNDTHDINLTNQEPTIFASIPSIFMLIGCVTSIYTMTFGRRIAITSGSLTNIIGWTVIASSYNIPQLLIGRIIAGFAMGLCTVPGVAYISEMTTIKLSPTLNSCSSLFISLGTLFIYFLGYIIEGNWRLVACFPILVSLLSTLLTIIYLPESPRWLLIQNQEEKAKQSLLKLRGLKNKSIKFENEFTNMILYNESKYGKKNQLNTVSITLDSDNKNFEIISLNHSEGNIFQKLSSNIVYLMEMFKISEVWKPFLILNTFFFFQQFCGIYVVNAYAVKLVSKTGITQDPFQVTVIIGILQIFGELGQILTSSRLGRRKTAIISGVGMTISITTLGVYNQFFLSNELSTIPLVCIFIFVTLGTFGFVNLPWSMIGELYPTRYVHILGPITTCFCGLFNFSTIYLYPTLEKLSPIFAIYFYSFCSFCATIFIIFTLPETVGKSKMEIEKQFKKREIN